MITIHLDEIRATFVAGVAEAIQRVTAEGTTHATSLGVWLDGGYGGFAISLNEDDDTSFRCEEIATYTHPDWLPLRLPQIAKLSDEVYKQSDEDDWHGLNVWSEGVIHNCSSHEEFRRFLQKEAVGWVKDTLARLPRGGWRPVWIQVEESHCDIIWWKCEQGPAAPPAPAWASEPLSIAGFQQPMKGIKVFKIGSSERKYGSLFTRDESLQWLDGQSKKSESAEPRTVNSYFDHKRLGALARINREFALLESSPQYQEAVHFLQPDTEFLPVTDGTHIWQIVHALDPVEVLDHAAAKLAKRDGLIVGVERYEFNSERLQKLNRSIFKVAEAPSDGPFFLESEETESFLKFCQRSGLRGVQFELVWCEDLTSLTQQLEEFLRLVDARLQRLVGNSDISNWMNVECLYQVQIDLWKLGSFRKILNEEGVTEGVRRVPGLRQLEIPCIRHLVPVDWWWFNDEDFDNVVRKIEPILVGKEILEDMRGYLCQSLPTALANLRFMERTNSGRLSIYGPSV